MTAHEYLAAEFRRYFLDATSITAAMPDDELITVDVINDDPEHAYHIIFDCTIGSDDDYYIFYDADAGRTITVPLMADALDL